MSIKVDEIVKSIRSTITDIQAIPNIKSDKFDSEKLKSELIPELETQILRIDKIQELTKNIDSIREEIIQPVNETIKNTTRSGTRFTILFGIMGLLGTLFTIFYNPKVEIASIDSKSKEEKSNPVAYHDMVNSILGKEGVDKYCENKWRNAKNSIEKNTKYILGLSDYEVKLDDIDCKTIDAENSSFAIFLNNINLNNLNKAENVNFTIIETLNGTECLNEDIFKEWLYQRANIFMLMDDVVEIDKLIDKYGSTTKVGRTMMAIKMLKTGGKINTPWFTTFRDQIENVHIILPSRKVSSIYKQFGK